MKYQLLALLIFSAILVNVSCGQREDAVSLTSQENSLEPTKLLTKPLPKNTPTLLVTDVFNMPIPRAQILIGPQANVPFPGNFLTANDGGELSLPAGWVDRQPITVHAPGFVRTTFFAQTPKSLRLQLRNEKGLQRIEVQGKTTDYANLVNDGYLDISLVMPLLSRGSWLNFQLASLISPESDPVKAAGKTVYIPSNLSIPRQTENYFIPVKFDKPVYRQFVWTEDIHHFVALHAKFPLEDVVDDLRGGKTFYDTFNDFNFQGSSIRSVATRKFKTPLDIPVNDSIYQKALSFTAPNFDPKYSLLVLPLNSYQNLLHPTDLKRLAPNGKTKLSHPGTSLNTEILTVLKVANSNVLTGAQIEEVSVAIAPLSANKNLEILPIAKAPSVGAHTVLASPPTSSSTLQSVATLASLSDVTLVNGGNIQFEDKIPKWDLYAPQWATQFDLPQWPIPTARAATQRWEVLFLANQNVLLNEPLGISLLEKVSHVTRSAVDF